MKHVRNLRSPINQYNKKYSSTGAIVSTSAMIIVLGVAGMWWNRLESKDTHLISAVVSSPHDTQLISAAEKTASTQVPDGFTQVKNIFEENCVSCHGAERQQGKFRMDTLAAVLKGGSSGKPALVKGSADKSLIYKLT